jgi:hypothetical protein
MKRLGLFVFALLITFNALAIFDPAQAQAAPDPAQTQSATSARGAMVVYVSDFDLDVVPRKPSPKPTATRTPPRPKPASTSRSSSGVPRKGPSFASEQTPSQGTDTAEGAEASKDETPADQANALVKAVSENIIRALTKAGFDARRLSSGAPLPQQGVRIRGVFAEPDEMNRARRLLVGGEPIGPNIILYVGVNNLKNPEQPLYSLADPPAPDPRHGPVITITSYAPAERFEVSRDPSGEELEKVAAKVAADLSALVSANRLSLAE